MQLSNEQSLVAEAFNDLIVSGSNVRVHALAGTGKTTLLRHLSHEGHSRKLNGLYLTFNREAAKSAGLSKSCTSYNWHRLAVQQLGKLFGTRVSDNFSAPGISETSLAAQLSSVRAMGRVVPPRWVARQVLRAINTARLTDSPRILPSHVRLTRTELLPEGMADIQEQVAAAANDAVKRELIPYAHADYLKEWATVGDPLFGLNPDYVLVDEAQDLPDLLRSVLINLRCSVILVGDRYQFLNGFAGASLTSMEDSAFGDILPLTKSWRFGQSIADIGNESLEALGSPIFLEGVGSPFPSNDTVHLVGTNKQAFDLSEALFDSDPCVVGSERLGRQRSELLRLRADRSARSSTFAGLGYDDLVASPTMFPDVPVLLSSLDHPSYHSLNKASDLTISTIHKFKGLQASNVVLHENAIPAEKSDYSAMLRYVAVTRAMTHFEIR